MNICLPPSVRIISFKSVRTIQWLFVEGSFLESKREKGPRNKKLLGTKSIATRSKDATNVAPGLTSNKKLSRSYKLPWKSFHL